MILLELPRDKIAKDECSAVTETEARPLSRQIRLEQEKGLTPVLTSSRLP